jgi:hypothetical protein
VRPELAAEIDKSIKTLARNSMDRGRSDEDCRAGGFGSRLSEAELKEIDTFFKSPAGRSSSNSQPVDSRRDVPPA